MSETSVHRIRVEFNRLLGLEAFRLPFGTQLGDSPPHLKIAQFNRVVHKHGGARGGTHVKLNIGTNVDWYSVQETLIHELAHIVVQRRWSLREGHSDRFWRLLDQAVQEAYGPLTVAPRQNRYHGRIADALRRQSLDQTAEETVEEIDRVLRLREEELDWYPQRIPGYFTDPGVERELTPAEVAFLEKEPVEAYDRPPVIPIERLPEPLRSTEAREEPPPNMYGGALRFTLPVDVPAREERPTRTASRGVVGERDGAVLFIVQQFPGLTRARIDYKYEVLYDRYEGASTYNSLWRLKRDGAVHKIGNRWYAF